MCIDAKKNAMQFMLLIWPVRYNQICNNMIRTTQKENKIINQHIITEFLHPYHHGYNPQSLRENKTPNDVTKYI